MSTLAVVEQILRETEVPMSVRQIVEHARGRLPTKSKTPDTVVARDLSIDLKRKGDTSLFIRTEPGRYTLRELLASEDVAPAIRREGGREPHAVAAKPTPMASTAIHIERAGPRAARPASEPESTAQSSVRNA
jgi:hypothetical protein